MSLKTKVLLLTFFLFLSLNALVLAWRKSTPPPPPLTQADLDREVKLEGEEAIQARIDAMIQRLRSESLRKSLAQLYENDFFSWPGYQRSGLFIPQLPPPPTEDQLAIENILSNRRFRKVFSELQGLDRPQQVEMVRTSLRWYFDEYRRLYEEFASKFESQFTGTVVSSGSSIISPTMAITDTADRTPTIYGTRLALLSLLVAAGNLQLDECRAVVEEILEYATQQRDALYSRRELHAIYRSVTVATASLYNRQALATALVGVTGGDGLQDFGDGVRTVSLTSYDSPATVYDLHYRHGAIRIKQQAKELPVSYVSSIDDDQFDRLVREAE